MKLITRGMFVVVAATLAAPLAWSQSPREQLNQLVTQLRASPGDAALRERIIQLAQEIKPPPAVPEEAERRLGRGQAAFEVAREPADFDKAIAEFNAASNEAPWLGAAYYNTGVAQEKAKRYREAMANFRLYLLASPGASDTSEIRQRIFKLEYLAEQPPARPSEQELLASLNGARFLRTGEFIFNNSRGDHIYEVRGRSVFSEYIFREVSAFDRENNRRYAGQVVRNELGSYTYKGGLRWESNRDTSCGDKQSSSACFANSISISEDGRTLTWRYFVWSSSSSSSITYLRN